MKMKSKKALILGITGQVAEAGHTVHT